MQDMAGGRAREAATSSLGAADSSSVASTLVTSSQFPSTQSYWDSDFETEPDPPDWRHTINQEELASLNPREKQRQDVINGESNSQFQFTNPNPIEKFFLLVCSSWRAAAAAPFDSISGGGHSGIFDEFYYHRNLHTVRKNSSNHDRCNIK